MYVDGAVLKETQPHERRVALVPAGAARLTKLGARLHMQSGGSDAIRVPEAAYDGVAFSEDRNAMVADADVVLCVRPPALAVVNAMKPGAILISFVYSISTNAGQSEPETVHLRSSAAETHQGL